MSKRVVAIAAAVFALVCFGATGAQASTPVSGSGTSHVTVTPVSSRTADGNTFVSFTFVETITGLYSGTRVGDGSFVIHPDGTVTVRDSGVFTGTIAGRTGTAMTKFEGVGTFAALAGQLQANDGTLGLAGLHGEVFATGSAVGPGMFASTYSGRAQFGAP